LRETLFLIHIFTLRRIRDADGAKRGWAHLWTSRLLLRDAALILGPSARWKVHAGIEVRVALALALLFRTCGAG
jgi:hypothetical protein